MLFVRLLFGCEYIYVTIYMLPTGSRGKKLSKKEMDTQQEISRNKEAVAWSQSSRVKKCNLLDVFMVANIPTDWLEVPRAGLEARLFYDAHAVDIKSSIKKKGFLKVRIEVLVFAGELRGAGIDPDNMVFDITKPKPPGVHFYAIIGAHSTGAVQSLHSDRPKHADWLKCPCVLLCCEDTEANVDLAVVYGGIDNMVGDTKKALNVWDITQALHTHRVRIEARNMDKKRTREAWVKAKSDVCSRHAKVNAASLGSLLVVAQFMGKTWDLIFKIMMGKCADVDNKKIVVPSNLAWAKDMAGIPDVDLQRWLKRMVNADFTAKDFSNRCLLYKKQVRVQQDITEYINTMRPDDELADFTAVGQKYVAFRKRELFDSLVNWCGALAKEKLNQHVQDVCRDILDAHDRAVANETEVNFVLLFACIIQIHNMFVCVTGKNGCTYQYVRHRVPYNHGKWSNSEVVSLRCRRHGQHHPPNEIWYC